ncbi:MAG: hypothetical protein JRI80_16775 [Deltaproteobacteria bacterium]|nr:hypothetical protein [Deltaproteobacteria bacterium]
MTDMDTELAAIINDEKMTDTEMALYVIRFMEYARQSKNPQWRYNFITLTRELAEGTLRKITNPYAIRLVMDALKKLAQLQNPTA